LIVSWLINGIPLHPLFVHVTVVAVPVVGLLALGAGWSNKLRTWLGVVLPTLASVTFVAALFTKQAGEALAAQVAPTPALSAHIEIADIAVAGAFLLLLVTWWQWAWSRRRAVLRAADSGPATAGTGRRGRMATTIAVVETAVAVFAIVGVVMAGDTGARAVWAGLL
jgi:hypothetical protein